MGKLAFSLKRWCRWSEFIDCYILGPTFYKVTVMRMGLAVLLVDNKLVAFLLTSSLVRWVRHIFSPSYPNDYPTTNAFIMRSGQWKIMQTAEYLSSCGLANRSVEAEMCLFGVKSDTLRGKHESVRKLRNRVGSFAFGANKQGSSSIVQSSSVWKCVRLCTFGTVESVIHFWIGTTVCACRRMRMWGKVAE